MPLGYRIALGSRSFYVLLFLSWKYTPHRHDIYNFGPPPGESFGSIRHSDKFLVTLDKQND